MVSKRITENAATNSPFSILHSTFVWDDWNILRETVTVQSTTAPPHYQTTTQDYVWGLDINGTFQGAGGVGGLLAVFRFNSSTPNSSTPQLYFPTYDANGNVSEYVTTNGEIVAHYDYSPFGETLIESGDLADTFTHRFSTKPWCPVTGLYEYQMRKYRPEIGRWMSRDPAGIEGGVNECILVANSVLGKVDYLGLLGDEQAPSQCDCADDDINKAAIVAIDRAIEDMRRKNDGHERCGRLCCNKTSGLVNYTMIEGFTRKFKLWSEILRQMVEASVETCDPTAANSCDTLGTDFILAGYFHSHPNSPSFSPADREWIKPKDVPFFVGIGDGTARRLDPIKVPSPPAVTFPPFIPGEPIETIIK